MSGECFRGIFANVQMFCWRSVFSPWSNPFEKESWLFVWSGASVPPPDIKLTALKLTQSQLMPRKGRHFTAATRQKQCYATVITEYMKKVLLKLLNIKLCLNETSSQIRHSSKSSDVSAIYEVLIYVNQIHDKTAVCSSF
jgi:hypothetical protein